MNNKTKVKLKLKPEYIEDIYNTYPNAFNKVEHTIKINYKNNNFIKLMKKTVEWQKFIIDNIWITYLWYMNILLDTLDYDNKLDFKYLKQVWIKEWMIKICKKKFIEHNIVKKHLSYFYLNPEIAIKWEKINPLLLDLFK